MSLEASSLSKPYFLVRILLTASLNPHIMSAPSKRIHAISYQSSINIVFVLSLLALIYWSLATYVNVYKRAVGGAIFEILWVPMLIATIILPIVALVQVIQKRHTHYAMPLISLIMGIISIALMIF